MKTEDESLPRNVAWSLGRHRSPCLTLYVPQYQPMISCVNVPRSALTRSDNQVTILKEGARVWNGWRNKNLDKRIDLAHANLHGAQLSGVDLHIALLNNSDLAHADLSEANLWRAHLPMANLRSATLRKANLTDAYLSSVNLEHAELRQASFWNTNLFQAKLTEADLSSARLTTVDLRYARMIRTSLVGAHLVEVDFSYADLTNADLSNTLLAGIKFEGSLLKGTDFTGARFANVTFARCDLSEAKGLLAASHEGPSTIGIDTFYASRGKIPEAFLRGCGVPDDFIGHAISKATRALIFRSCFISYTSKDTEFAHRLYADLQRKGVRCWYAPEDLKIGDTFRRSIDESIRTHDKLLLVLSKQSVSSNWVEKEVETAMERERTEKRIVLFPIRLDDAVMKVPNGWPADIRRTRHIGDFQKWKERDEYRKALDRLLRDLAADQINAK